MKKDRRSKKRNLHFKREIDIIDKNSLLEVEVKNRGYGRRLFIMS